MRTGAANDLKTVGGCLKDLDHLYLLYNVAWKGYLRSPS